MFVESSAYSSESVQSLFEGLANQINKTVIDKVKYEHYDFINSELCF